jgi:hypothetical protein
MVVNRIYKINKTIATHLCIHLLEKKAKTSTKTQHKRRVREAATKLGVRVKGRGEKLSLRRKRTKEDKERPTRRFTGKRI